MHGHDLDKLGGKDALPHPPAEYMDIPLLVPVVEVDHEYYLLLKILLYDPLERRSIGGPLGEYWVLPGSSWPIQAKKTPAINVRPALEWFKEHGNAQDFLDAEAERLAWKYGLTDAKLTRLDPITMLKESIRVPEQWLAIKFHPYLVWTNEDAGLKNLADPEGRWGWQYLPLDDLERVIIHRDRDGCDEWCFCGKPIAMEVQLLLAREGSKLLDAPIRLRREHFCREEVGLLLSADLAGWGAGLKKAGRMSVIGISGNENVKRYIESTTAALYRFLSRIGPQHQEVPGDGIKAVFPRDTFDLHDKLRQIRSCWLDVLAHVETLNRDLRNQKVAIGSRLALHYGRYVYGRPGLARGIGPAIQGSSIVEVSRLEGGLGNLVHLKSSRGGEAARDWRHAVVVSQAAMTQLGPALAELTQGWDPAGRQRLTAKESKLDGHVWRVNL
jgi:hypothetical protein